MYNGDTVDVLPTALYRANQIREFDRRAIEELHIPAYELMNRAGAAALAFARIRFLNNQLSNKRITVVCGAGNNGGDGYVFARLAQAAGAHVTVVAITSIEHLQADAATAAQAWLSAGVVVNTWESLATADLIVDALLGIGLQREVEGRFAEVIHAINNAQAPILALDLPSGLHADTGRVLGVAVCATATITFVGLKQGLFTAAATDHVGELVFDDLMLPLCTETSAAAQRLTLKHLRACQKPRARNAHKNSYGHVLIIGGDQGMSGAVLLAAVAALRCGAGLVTIATRIEHASALNVGHPELMVHGVDTGSELLSLIQRADVIAIGPGLGQSKWARRLFSQVLLQHKPLIVDADALNLLAQDPVKHRDWILTPHPGEAARLLNVTTTTIQHDRFHAAKALSERFGARIVLKGAGSLVCEPEHLDISLCDRGNSGMATAGMGDVLTGVIAALLAQGFSLTEAARMGVLLHACAGDRAAGQTPRGLIASDMWNPLRDLVNGI
ncbi:MAG: NAD(P)H-hydrate dehydratase [Gammaproteobacteria bacterium]|nr:NAD(P)H-hydrate dehydratase [Gammaproteobacteria bacterium]